MLFDKPPIFSYWIVLWLRFSLFQNQYVDFYILVLPILYFFEQQPLMVWRHFQEYWSKICLNRSWWNLDRSRLFCPSCFIRSLSVSASCFFSSVSSFICARIVFPSCLIFSFSISRLVCSSCSNFLEFAEVNKSSLKRSDPKYLEFQVAFLAENLSCLSP